MLEFFLLDTLEGTVMQLAKAKVKISKSKNAKAINDCLRL